MSAARTLTCDALAGLVESLVGAGVHVIAPSRTPDGGVDYAPIVRLDQAVLDEDEMPRRSLRQVFQPPTEVLFTWRREGGRITLTPPERDATERVILGARPCDAAGAAVLDAVMGWDIRDEPWFARREAATILTLACRAPRPSCFCEALGSGPADPRGSDVVLHASSNGYLAEPITEKGEAFFSHHDRWLGEAAEAPARPKTGAAPMPLEDIRAWIEARFDDPFWDAIALRCLGCGACTSICPTCHCFDIVDEADGTRAGARRRNWDTCQAGLFTLHASGHNPRPDQTARCRQRVAHKFAIYPARFGQILCTGCGRCVEACPAGISIPEILREIADMASGAAPGGLA